MSGELEAMVETAVRALDPGIAWLLDGHEPGWSKENSGRYGQAAFAAREMIAALGIETLLTEREREVIDVCAQIADVHDARGDTGKGIRSAAPKALASLRNQQAIQGSGK